MLANYRVLRTCVGMGREYQKPSHRVSLIFDGFKVVGHFTVRTPRGERWRESPAAQVWRPVGAPDLKFVQMEEKWRSGCLSEVPVRCIA